MRKLVLLLPAIALVALVVSAAAKSPGLGPPQADPAGILDLPAGYSYTILATACTTQARSTESGTTFAMPEDFDANVLFKVSGRRNADRGHFWLLSSHELTQPRPGDWQGDSLPDQCPVPEQATADDGDSDGWGSVSRLTLGANGTAVLRREIVTTGLHNLCAGNPTPWGTMLVNEEFPYGRRLATNDPQKRSGWVWEIDPETGKATKLTGMGWMSHEQEDYDWKGRWYLSDDQGDFRFIYRFEPDKKRDLRTGKLYGLKFDRTTGTGTWVGPLDVNDPDADMVARFGAVRAVHGFQKGEGLVATKNRHAFVFSESGSGANPGNVWKFTQLTDGGLRGEIIAAGTSAQLNRPDNLRFNPTTGDLFIMEDDSVNQIWLLPRGETGAANLRLFAVAGSGYEPTGPWFSTDGKRLYLSLQGGPETDPPVAATRRGHVVVIKGDFERAGN